MFCIHFVFLFCINVGQDGTGTLHKWYQALERWHYEGEESTFQKLSMLQYITFSIAYTTPTLSTFIWYESKITLAMLREIGQILLKWTHQSFIKNVLLSYIWKMMGHITDNLSNTSSGYSFVSDHQNHKFHNCKSFLTLIIDTPTLQDDFIIRDRLYYISW